jgi:hypothetical protein
MPLQKNYETPATGATSSYHVVQQVGLDRVSTLTTATVASYLSGDAKAAGKMPMYTQQIQIDGFPANGQDAFDFAEAQLVVMAPDDAPVRAANRYVFSGAQMVPQSV